MTYYAIAICVAIFFIGYMTGLGRGYRKAHRNIVTNQSKRFSRAKKLYDPRDDESRGRQLYLVKEDRADVGD